ncbi:hypothetical protein RJ641_011473 [Dillenia turbinata]|uniref:ACT domain-containing protein ACR n=1 Tax=Dillenia turbinata TaxID=194707 RepID=A0AAN8UYI4_9MAGN
MDVFHVTDQLRNKLTDESFLLYIQQPSWTCHITAAEAWTYNTRAACIIYIDDGLKGGPISDPKSLAQVEEQIENVVEAHHKKGQKRSVRLTAPEAGRTRTERRLHQLMLADCDFDLPCDSYGGGSCNGSNRSSNGLGHNYGKGTQVSVGNYREKGYFVVHVKSEDRPKLLFDTVCAPTDVQFVEYYIRHKDGFTLDTAGERQRVIQSLVAAVERSLSCMCLQSEKGLRLDVCTSNKTGLLSNVTGVVFRENGLSIAEVGTQGEKAIGFFYITDASGSDVDIKTVELVRKEIGGAVKVIRRASVSGSLSNTPSTKASRTSTPTMEDRPRFSLEGLLWSQLERLSNNFSPTRS